MFKKSKIPGPSSKEQKRHQEVDKIVANWYTGNQTEEIKKPIRTSFWSLVLIFFVIFTIVTAAALFGIYWILQGNSSVLEPEFPSIVETIDSLILDLQAPQEIDSGETMKIIVTYQNTGKARLVDLNLDLFYPDNFIFELASPHKPQNSENSFWRLPSLLPQTSSKLEITGQVLGRRGDLNQIKAVLVYKPTNFHSTFKTEAQAEFTIKNSHLALELQAPDNLLTEQDLTCSVKVINTSEINLKNIKVKLDLPKGLEVAQEANLVDWVWTLPELPAKAEQVLEADGTIFAKAGELKEFKAEVGFDKDGQFVLQDQVSHIAAVIDPQINLKIQSDSTNLSFGDVLRARVFLANLSTLSLEDLELSIIVQDDQSLLLWKSFKLLDDYNYEIISESSDLSSGQTKIRFNDLPILQPIDEFNINFLFDLIKVPYDISAGDFAIKVTPYLKVSSKDLSVPIEVKAKTYQFSIINS